MKANELRIGNWIGQKGGSQFQVIVDVAEAPNFWKNNLDISHGIPLTEEWMVKFGFEDDLPWKYKQFRLDDQERLHIIDNSGYGSIISRGVKYVHQLQNIIHSLTGEELPIKEQAV